MAKTKRPSVNAVSVMDAAFAQGRPTPPHCLIAEPWTLTLPAPELSLWLKDTFIDPKGLLANPDHEPLGAASIGALWTNATNKRQGKTVLATAQLMPPGGSDGFTKARAIQQLEEWFGDVPDFLLTFSAAYCSYASNAQFCAIAEHELYHCRQKLDVFGAPMFDRKDGMPVWDMRGHDVEEFVGVIRRYGADASPTLAGLMVAAANQKPTFSERVVDAVCGCGRAAMSGSEAEERIRAKAEAMLRRLYPEARIIHELVLAQGGCRIDLAAVEHDFMAVIEIKSERDVLTRLEEQVKAALRVADLVAVCIAEKHAHKVSRPTHNGTIDLPWGVHVLAEEHDHFTTRYTPFAADWHGAKREHRLVNPIHRLEMLWAEEHRRIADPCVPRLARNASRGVCQKIVYEALSPGEIRRAVYRELRARHFPRADPPVAL